MKNWFGGGLRSNPVIPTRSVVNAIVATRE